MSVGEHEQRGLQRQTAQTTVSHPGHPATRPHTAASRSAGQTGGCLRARYDFCHTGHTRVHMGAPATVFYEKKIKIKNTIFIFNLNPNFKGF